MIQNVEWYETELRSLHGLYDGLQKSWDILKFDYKQLIKYKQGYEECRNILNPDQLKKIEKTLKELGIL